MNDDFVTSLADARARRAERAERANRLRSSGDPMLDGLDAIMSRFATAVLDATGTLRQNEQEIVAQVRRSHDTALGFCSLTFILLRSLARAGVVDATDLERDIRHELAQLALIGDSGQRDAVLREALAQFDACQAAGRRGSA